LTKTKHLAQYIPRNYDIEKSKFIENAQEIISLLQLKGLSKKKKII
jgi:hypothetical protein